MNTHDILGALLLLLFWLIILSCFTILSYLDMTGYQACKNQTLMSYEACILEVTR